CTLPASTASRSSAPAGCGARSSITCARWPARRRGSRSVVPCPSPPPPSRNSRLTAAVTPPSAPYHYESAAWRAGLARIAGLDEAGRGPLAGPVVAAAVIIASDRRVKKLCDSKLLTPERREALFQTIAAHAVAVGVGIVDHVTID